MSRCLTPEVAVVTDSVACLTRELVEQYGIEIIPLNIYSGGQRYRDWVDVTPSEVYELFLKEPESFKTSAASPAECLEVFRRARQRAANILCITVSSGLSTTYTCACEAKDLAVAELPGTNIEVMDSRTATPAEGFVALAAARAAAAGRSMAETTGAAMAVKEKVTCIVFLDTIKHVYRSGRVPKVASQIGSMLSIRPVLTIAGVVNFSGMARSRTQGLERMLQMMRDKVQQRPVHAAVMHAYAPDEAERLRERVAAEFKCVELWLAEFSPIMGYACGTGTLGVAFYTEV